MARVKIQITTPSNNVIKVSPGVSALSSVQLYLNELIDVNTQHGADGYVLTQQADGTFAMEAVATTLADLSDTNILNPQGGDSLVYDANAQKWVPGGVKSVNGQEGDVIISIPSPPPTPGVSGLADTNITNLQDDQIIRYDSASGNWLNEDLEALPAGGTTGQALVKASNTDYDVAWDDIAVDVQFHQRYATEAETLRSGATETVELYFFAQGDGNGLAESASSDTPTSGYDIRRKLWYAEKAQADPDTSADWTQFTAIADNTTFANAKAALLAYLKERTGGTVPISLKMTWEEVAQAPAFTGLLNESYGSGAEAAYSTRRLNGNVTDCMVIRRASDSTTQTIGFDGSGNIDEAAIETFCTGTTCTVYQWLDQSGNGNDATAAATNDEPTIYTGGALVKENGKVAVDFDGDYLNHTLGTSAGYSTNHAIFVLTSINTSSAYSLSFAAGNNGDATNGISLLTNASASTGNWGTYAGGSIFSGTSLHDGTRRLLSMLRGVSGNGAFYTDGTSDGSYSGTSGSTQKSVGHPNTKDNIQEVVFYASDKSGADQASIESNIGDYFTQNTPLLDTYSGAAAAYSLRLLDSTYTGALVEVYNGSSYADIGANVFGELDTVALAAHCGSNDGFVSKWYDQAGSNTATQTSTLSMPKIYDGTTGVVTQDGKPAVEFDGGPDHLDFSSVNVVSAFIVARSSGHDYANRLFRGTGFISTSGYDSNVGRIGAGDGTNSLFADGTNNDTNRYLIEVFGVGASGSLYLNSNSEDSGTLNAISVNEFGSAGTTLAHHGPVQEVVFYTTDQSANRTNIEDNINTFYSIY